MRLLIDTDHRDLELTQCKYIHTHTHSYAYTVPFLRQLVTQAFRSETYSRAKVFSDKIDIIN